MCFKLVLWTVYVLQSSNPEYITVGMKYLGLLFQKGLYILQNLDFAIGQNISHLAAGNTSFFILTEHTVLLLTVHTVCIMGFV